MSESNAPSAQGRLIVVHGSMFAGKTERMIAWLRHAETEGRSVRAFKHNIDDRYDAVHLITHTQDRFPATRVPSAEAILELSDGIEFVAIDEGHFFGDALMDVVKRLSDRGASVMVAGITHDAWGRPFSPMPELAEAADKIHACLSPCRVCGEPAEYTQRMVAVHSPTMVGGIDEYEPRCKEHFTPLTGSPDRVSPAADRKK